MNSNDQYLWPLFKAEYISRIAHIREILNECYGQGFSRIYFDRIHQEFDSINGASRVVHREDIGELARLSASYARHLRIQLPNGLDDSQLVLLEALIVLAEGDPADQYGKRFLLLERIAAASDSQHAGLPARQGCDKQWLN